MAPSVPEPDDARAPQDVPAPDDDWDAIAHFAHTFNGDEYFGAAWSERFKLQAKRLLIVGAG